jgi:DNA-directed RNA polymerase specialized sigma24 family protein
VLPPETKHSLVTSLALRLWTSGVEQVHHRELVAHIAENVGPTSDLQTLVEMDSELRTASFLVRNAGGEYRFAHKSYAEFFVAGHLARSLDAGQTACLNIVRRLTREHLSFFADMVRNRKQADEVLTTIVTSAYVANVSENALLCLYALRKGATMRAGKAKARVELPDGMQLNGAALEVVQIVNAKMQHASLIGAQLYDADLRGCDLTDADLSNSDCRNALMEGAWLTWAHCEHTDFTDANLTSAKLSGANFTGALIDGAVLVGTQLDRQDAESMLVRRWFPMVTKLVDEAIKGDSDAGDVVQQVLLDLAIGSKSKQRPAIAEFTESEVIKLVHDRIATRRLQGPRDRVRSHRDTGRQALATIPSADLSLEDRVAFAEVFQRLEKELTPLNAQAIRLWLAGYSDSEIASTCDLSRAGVMVQRARALKILRQSMSH